MTLLYIYSKAWRIRWTAFLHLPPPQVVIEGRRILDLEIDGSRRVLRHKGASSVQEPHIPAPRKLLVALLGTLWEADGGISTPGTRGGEGDLAIRLADGWDNLIASACIKQ